MDTPNKQAYLAAVSRVLQPEQILLEEPMSAHTTFRIGGNAEVFLQPGSAEEVQEVVRLAEELSFPYTIIGNGSNLLVADEGVAGAVIRIGKQLSRIQVTGQVITAEAGALLSQIAAKAQEAGLTGFEFAGGIPGTLGGACVMNAGAYDGEMKQVLLEVTCLNEERQIVTLPPSELALGYRTSIFQKRSLIVLSAKIGLQEGRPEDIAAKSADFRQRRQSKQPLELPSAGSTFKRPEGYFAGKLIMDAGLRGYQVGGAAVSEKHCGFVVNLGGATAKDVLTLVQDVQEKVKALYGVQLEMEIKQLGFDR